MIIIMMLFCSSKKLGCSIAYRRKGSLFFLGMDEKIKKYHYFDAVSCAPVRHGQLSGFESRHPSKFINGRHKRRSGRHTLARQKKYIKKRHSG
jgi:hypothetical protein